ncbi:MAG: DMT family protein [Acidobacteriota bacterium]
MRTTTLLAILLLLLSNIFMTIAWYGHLKLRTLPMWTAVLGSWGIAFFEYCLQVPANRIGSRALTAYHLKTIQEVITLCVFVVFAWSYLGESLRPKHVAGFVLLFGAVWVIFQDRFGMSW